MRIDELVLECKNFQVQKEFYDKILELPVYQISENEFSVDLQSSKIRFRKNNEATPYHFAINIPSFKIEEAHNWLKEKVEILPDGKNNIIDFPEWNAKSVYFHDADKNIVELIERRNLNIISNDTFSSEQFINVSEIGMPVDDIAITLSAIREIHSIPVYSGNTEIFCAAGNEEGLLIIIDRNKKKWFPSEEVAFSSDFMVKGSFDFRFYSGIVS